VSTLQEQARALGDPTRHALFRVLADADRPLTVAELTERFPFNHTAIRQHLTKLTAAGLVVETTAPAQGRGRPRHLYAVDPATDGRWGTTSPYERLSVLLAEVIRSGRTPTEVGRRAAAHEGAAATAGTRRAPGGTGTDDPVVHLTDAMARQGFEPHVRTTDGRTEIVLENCPFETAALTDRETVCALHLGLAQGLVEGTEVSVDELVAFDPRRAGCRLRLRGDGPADGTAGAGVGRERELEPHRDGELTLRGRPRP
jgi:predicted ArsR family transcriptional regulator